MPKQLKSEDARSIAGTSLTGSFQDVGVVTTQPARVVQVFNGCDEQVLVSWDDGSTTVWDLPPNAGAAVDASTNRDTEQIPYLPVGSQFQAMHDGVAPSEGKLTITVIY